MMHHRLARGLPALVFLAAIAGCDNALLNDPAALGSATVVLHLSANAAAGGPGEAFDKADRVRVRVPDGNTVRVDRVVNISGGRDVTIPLEFELKRATENLTAEVEVQRGSALLFRGSAELRLRVGRLPSVSVELEPVTNALVLPDSLPVIDSYGDTVHLNGALVFATGDTVNASLVEQTLSLDPGVIAIEGGVAVTRGDGLARLVGQTEEWQDTTRVRVRAAVRTIEIVPGTIDVTIGSTQQFQAKLYDRRGNEITGRTVVWASSAPGVVSIDADGTAVARGIGSSEISAEAEAVTSTVTVRATPKLPDVDTDSAVQVYFTTAVLRATVDPHSVAADLWFEVDTDSLFPNPRVTAIQSVPPGGPVQRFQSIDSLAPLTTYYVRAFARNSAGTTAGDREQFTTLSTQLSVTTGSAINVTPFSATLLGTITLAGDPASVWVEWGSNPLLIDPAITPLQFIRLTQGTIPVSFQLSGLYPGDTYYYRVVGQSTTGSTAVGATLSFVTTGGSVVIGPEATTLAAQPVRADSAVANGIVNPNGDATDAWFEWSTDPSFATWSSTPARTVGSGTSSVAFADLLVPLVPGTSYYVRIVAATATDTVRGAVVTFVANSNPTGPAPTVTTLAATGVAQTSATVNGSANPQGSPTVVWFEWGTSPTLTTFNSTAPVAIGSTSTVAFAEFIGNLSRTSLGKYFRAVAMNGAGTTRGSIRVFELRN